MPLLSILQILSMPVEYSDTGFEHLTEADEDTVFVLDNFEGDIFSRLHRAGARIMGPAVLNKCANNNEVDNRNIYRATTCCYILVINNRSSYYTEVVTWKSIINSSFRKYRIIKIIINF